MYTWVYKSLAAVPPHSVPEAQIWAVSARRNPEAAITGHLHRAGGQFVQVVEGPEDSIAALRGRVVRDWRHGDVVTLRAGPIAARRFDRWTVSFSEAGGAAEQVLAGTGAADAEQMTDLVLSLLLDLAHERADAATRRA